MSFTNYSLDTFVSQHMSELTACAPQSLAAEFPKRKDWLDEFVLRRIFHNHVADERAPLAFILIRRAEAALDEWELACAAASGAMKVSGYFRTLRHLENCVAALWQGLAFGQKALGAKLFEKGGGSPLQRLNEIYNVSRHFDPSNLSAGDLHRLWISNDGLNTREHSLTFNELRDELKVLAGVADKVATSSSSTE